MKFLYTILLTAFMALVLVMSPACFQKYSDKQINENYHAVIVVAALEEMYWFEYNKIFTKSELDDLGVVVQASLEDAIKTRLTPELIERIKRLRRGAKYDW